MSKVIANISMSVDGYIAGPNPTLDEPMGMRGEELHEWVYNLKAWREPHGLEGGETGVDNDVMIETTANIGAVIMGRKMFSGGEGGWENDPNPNGWWGDNPPFHVPVFVLTSHNRETLNMDGGTSFTFITTGVSDAFSQAKAAAQGKVISVAGGAQTIQQLIKAKLVNELQIHLVPILLGGGTRLLENLGDAKLNKKRVIDSLLVTHLYFDVS